MTSTNNKYVSHMYAVYDKVFYPEKYDIQEETTYFKYGFYSLMKHKRITKKNIGLRKAVDDAMSFISENCSSPMSYDDIVDFCDFIRIAEKILVYNNDISEKLFVDSSVDESEKKMVIKFNDDKIILSILLKKLNGLNVIDIKVTRDFGKKMVNTILIVDGHVDYKDDSDLYLINSINNILCKYVRETYEGIIQRLKVQYIEEETEI